MDKKSYFDKSYFAACIGAAIYERWQSVGQFATYNFGYEHRRAVQNWVGGKTIPTVPALKKLCDIFGEKRVKSWLKFSF